MTVLQHYYTSFVNRESGRAGFQVKAMSPGISAEAQAMIARLIAYRIPNGVEERKIEKHPVALRYFYHNPHECILLCSQSSGNDENGRPGNFFAHSVVMSPDELANQPPILYWHSPFWRKQAAETQLKPLLEFDAEPSLDIIDEVWTFLADGSRKEAFYKLMCAVVQSERTKRRIIIIDSDKHVALWVAAVSSMLPPAYRPLLSFATYHHDPYQSWFLITGTTDDSAFRSAPEESVSHFVLDGKTNRTSPAEDSQYANLVRTYATPERYETYMLGFFLWYEQRFPKPTCIDERLDLFAFYVHLRRKKDPVTFSASILKVINIVLDTFEKLPASSDEDREELAHLKDVLEDARQKSRKVEVQEAYNRVVHLYQKHNIPTDDIFKDNLRYCTELLLTDRIAEAAVRLLKQLHQMYNDDLFVTFVNQPDYLQYVVDTLLNSSHDKLLLIWKHIGPYLRPGSHSQVLFLRSLRMWENLLQNNLTPQANELLSLIKNTLEGRELEWLRLLVGSTTGLPDLTIERFYWQLVSTLSLEQREPYRAIVQQVVPTIVDLEFGKELAASHLQSKIEVICRWVTYTTGRPAIKAPADILSDGLALLKGQCNPRQWKVLMADVLMQDELLPLLGPKEEMLVKEVLSELSLQEFSAKRVTLYKRYKDHHSLPSRSKDVLAGMVAMADSHLDGEVVTRLYDYVSGLASEERYAEEIRCFINVFFEAHITEEEHLRMLSALFVSKYQERFWFSYWEKMYALLTRLLTNDLERSVRLFSFWFVLVPNQFSRPDQHYVVHQFFLNLQRDMNSAQQILPNYSKALDNLVGKTSSYTWYPLIQELLQVRQRGFARRGQEWVKFVQKKFPLQKSNEQAQELERKLSIEIGSLLAKGAIREQHIHNLRSLYQKASRELFWTFYEEHLMRVLSTADVEHILQVFSFWFDESFQYLGQEPYIAQEFFIRLPAIRNRPQRARERFS